MQVRIDVYEGESRKATDNKLLDTFTLSGIPPLPAGEPRILVRFKVDFDGTLSASAHDKTPGAELPCSSSLCILFVESCSCSVSINSYWPLSLLLGKFLLLHSSFTSEIPQMQRAWKILHAPNWGRRSYGIAKSAVWWKPLHVSEAFLDVQSLRTNKSKVKEVLKRLWVTWKAPRRSAWKSSGATK